MATVRITKDLRTQIIWRALSDTFDARQQLLYLVPHSCATRALQPPQRPLWC